MQENTASKLPEVGQGEERGDDVSCSPDTNANRGKTNKLTDQEKLFVCQQIATFKGNLEISKLLEAEFGVKILPGSVDHYRNSTIFAPVIKQIRDNILKDVSHIPMAHKSKRLQRVYDTAMMINHTSTTKFGEKIMRNDARTAAIAVEYARREMEGDATLRLIGEDGEPAQTGVMRTPSRSDDAQWEEDVAADVRDEQAA